VGRVIQDKGRGVKRVQAGNSHVIYLCLMTSDMGFKIYFDVIFEMYFKYYSDSLATAH